VVCSVEVSPREGPGAGACACEAEAGVPLRGAGPHRRQARLQCSGDDAGPALGATLRWQRPAVSTRAVGRVLEVLDARWTEFMRTPSGGRVVAAGDVAFVARRRAQRGILEKEEGLRPGARSQQRRGKA
jgi:hypothetical protein